MNFDSFNPKVYHVFLDNELLEGFDFDIIQDNIRPLYHLLASRYTYLDVLDLTLKIQRVGNTTSYYFSSPPVQEIEFDNKDA